MKIIEASIVMPMTILIAVALIGLMMHFYMLFSEQVDDHGILLKEAYAEIRVEKY